MRAEVFVQSFAHLAEAPGGVARLRELVLQLAVRGKLVRQRPDSETGTDLLKTVATERARVVDSGVARRRKIAPIDPSEVPFSVPRTWAWARLASVGHDLGQQVPKDRFTYIDVGSINKDRSCIGTDLAVLEPDEAPSRARKLVREGTVIYSTVRPYLLNIAVIDRVFDPDPIASTAFGILHPLPGMSNRFMYYYLRSGPFIEYVEAEMMGMAYPAINDTKFYNGLIPVPPTEEQHRIVAKVDQLMVLCDELEERQERRNETRIALNEASLDRLVTAPDDKAFTRHWHRIRDHFDVLYDTVEAVSELRERTLDLALRGRLVSQDPAEEGARAALRRAAEARDLLVAARVVKRGKPLPQITPEEMWFELPAGWVWARFGAVAVRVQTGPFGSLLHKRDYVEDGVPLVNPQNIGPAGISVTPGKTVPQDLLSKLSRYVMHQGDVVLGRRGEMGKCAVIGEREDGWLCGTGSLFFRFGEETDPFFIAKFLQAPSTRAQLGSAAVGSTMNNLSEKALSRLVVPLPPASEQSRIVSRADQLWALCGQLEARLSASQTRAETLMDSVVHHLVAA